MNICSAGKGDDYRPVDKNKWSRNWDRIFNKKGEQKDEDNRTRTGNR